METGLGHLVGGLFLLCLSLQFLSEYRHVRCPCLAWWAGVALILAAVPLLGLLPGAGELTGKLLPATVPFLVVGGLRSFGQRALGARGFQLLSGGVLVATVALLAAAMGWWDIGFVARQAAIPLLAILGFPALVVVGWRGLAAPDRLGYGWLLAAGATLAVAAAPALFSWTALYYGLVLAAVGCLFLAGLDEHAALVDR